jgi:translation initiation factor IF-2
VDVSALTKQGVDHLLELILLQADLMELKAVFGKWWGEQCGILEANPFADIDPPKVDRREPHPAMPRE